MDIPPPPLPPKPLQAAPHGPSNRRHPQPRVLVSSGYDNHTNFRQRATSHDSRPSSKTTGRGSSATNGSTGSFRGRLSSDGSGSAQSSGGLRVPPSSAGVDKQERSLSPPNTPPPPYTEFDNGHHRKPPPPPPAPATSNGNRHFSLSQQDPGSSAYSSTHMQRTRSHGQVPYQRVNIHRVATTPGGPVGDVGQRAPAIKTPTELVGGGTLV